MDQKPSTDIDRKLAIYYHPLFQEVIKAILDLFKVNDQKFQIGLLQFVQFNLKLQKSLLPSFQIDNALVSGLNDWVKQVAQCLTYDGMVSTAGCVQVNSLNIQSLLLKQCQSINIELFQSKEKYLQTLLKISNHDAFKLLGVKINKEVFSKFMFDLCSTWCEFLDVELFSYFLTGLYIQISEGETIAKSSFKGTSNIVTIDLEFMEEFQEIKNIYSRSKKKELRYYRAWCEWNYLRVNDIGEKLILKLDELNPQDNRILQLALIFQKSIQIINQEITNQNPPIEDKVIQREKSKEKEKEKEQNKDFLILKKLNIENNTALSKNKEAKKEQVSEIYDYAEDPYENQVAQDFEIEIDDQGNMYLKRMVKLPIIGIKIEPQSFGKKIAAQRALIEKKKNQYRSVSNLYRRMQNMKVRLEHNTKNDHYSYKKSPKIQQRDKFYEKAQSNVQNKKPERKDEMQKTIHEKMVPKEQQKKTQAPEIPKVLKQQKISIREMKQYNYKVMAPVFMTDNQNNVTYAKNKQGQVYANTAVAQKRDLKIGLPKVKNYDFRVKQLKSYHVVGKLTTDRSLINEKVKSFSTNQSKSKILQPKEKQAQKLQEMKQQNKYIWNRYIDEDQVKQLTNYQDFYRKLEKAKSKFGKEFQSEFRVNLKPILAYENKRHQMGGVIGKEEQQRFSQRMKRLINKQNRRNNRRKRKEKLRNYRKNFKNKNQKTLFEDIFINYHRQAIKDIKVERQKLKQSNHKSMINY